MKPTHIDIVGKSKVLFVHHVVMALWNDRASVVVKQIPPNSHTLVLAESVTSADDTLPLQRFLERHGITRSDIRLRYETPTPSALVRQRLGAGLSESRLSFGGDVAEHDDALESYFIETPAFQAVRMHRKHVVLGPKGSGKSAILRSLMKSGPHAILVTPEDYATDVLAVVLKQPIANELAALTTTWKYTLLVEIFRTLVQLGSADSAAIDQLRRYLVDHGQLGQELTMLERFLGYLRRITKVKLGPVEGELGGDRELEALFKMDELLGLIPSLQTILRRRTFTVYIDELDQSWNNTREANNFLVSLLIAAIQLRSLSDNLHVVVFLRSEIFDLLAPHLPQLDKLQGQIETLRWTQKDLTNLIASRIMYSLGISEKDGNTRSGRSRAMPSAESIVGQVFTGNVRDANIDTFSYLLTRTSLRPREVIQFCNLALALAVRSGAPQITDDIVLRAEEEFSDWKGKFIASENLHIYPGLGDFLEMFRGQARRLSDASLDGILAGMILEADAAEKRPQWRSYGEEPEDYIKVLYQLEIVGVQSSSERHDERRAWEGYDFVFQRPKAHPERASNFLFHPALWKSLELK